MLQAGGQGGHSPLTFEHVSQGDSVIIDTWQIASTCSVWLHVPIKSIMEVQLCLEWDLRVFADVTCSCARFVSKLHSDASDIHNLNLQHAM